MRSRPYLAVLLALALIPTARAADGDLLSREVYSRDGMEITRETITYESDGLTIAGFLAYPADASADAPLPCLVFNRGGNRDFGKMSPKRFAYLSERLCTQGYVLIASNYRGVEESEGADEFGGADVNDVVNALNIFDQLDFADSERIGMWGHSRGGMMTYLALLRTDRVDAAVVSGGVADARLSIEDRPVMEPAVFAQCVPGWEDNREAELDHRSAILHASDMPDDCPVLIAHGTSDWRVSPTRPCAWRPRCRTPRSPTVSSCTRAATTASASTATNSAKKPCGGSTATSATPKRCLTSNPTGRNNPAAGRADAPSARRMKAFSYRAPRSVHRISHASGL